MDTERLKETMAQLSAWLPPESHIKRDLPGGGTSWFIPWETLKARLEDVRPDYQLSWGDPKFLGELCFLKCVVTIDGVSREGIGTAPTVIISAAGKNVAYGNCIERARADAFKQACVFWGLGAYIKEQNSKTRGVKNAFLKYVENGGVDTTRGGKGKPSDQVTSSAHQQNTQPSRRRTQKPRRDVPTTEGFKGDINKLAELTQCPLETLKVLCTNQVKSSLEAIDEEGFKKLRAIAFNQWAEMQLNEVGIRGKAMQLWADFLKADQPDSTVLLFGKWRLAVEKAIASGGQRIANGGQRRPTAANGGQRRPTAANGPPVIK